MVNQVCLSTFDSSHVAHLNRSSSDMLPCRSSLKSCSSSPSKKSKIPSQLSIPFNFTISNSPWPLVVSWSPPSLGSYKLNVDGSSLGNLGKADCGGLVRDHSGLVLVAFAKSIGYSASLQSESAAVLMGMQIFHSYGYLDTTVEMDCQLLSCITNNTASILWSIDPIIRQIWALATHANFTFSIFIGDTTASLRQLAKCPAVLFDDLKMCIARMVVLPHNQINYSFSCNPKGFLNPLLPSTALQNPSLYRPAGISFIGANQGGTTASLRQLAKCPAVLFDDLKMCIARMVVIPWLDV
ncbi:hypothetical protein ACH5RR_001310 [Cinchona calisaya]|uniref:RNase H type-1 domain-containing protein n=1 Tax=Cinchona calisaya TaxID=153742 RepID=A0ABD3B347_9GENT